jgi:hypothetical protein
MASSKTFDSSDARSSHLARFLGAVLSGKRPVQSAGDGRLLLESICSEPDPTRCIEKLVASKTALKGLQQSFRFDVSPSFLNGPSVQLLKYIADPSVKALCSGQMLQAVIEVIVEPPTFWHALLQAQRNGTLNDDAVRCLAWLLLELLIAPDMGPENVRDTAESFTHQNTFLGSSSFDTRTIGQKIKNVLLVTGVSTSYHHEYKPGGRHDNDFADYREIAILPTADELQSTEKPFYRLSSAVNEVEAESRPALHLDNQFRLLREDFLNELRTDLQAVLGQNRGTGKRRNLVLTDLGLQGPYFGTQQKHKPCGLALYCNRAIPQLKGLSSMDVKSYLKANPRFLKHDSFGCLLNDNEVVAFGNVERDEDLLAQAPPILVLRIADSSAFSKALLAIKTGRNIRFVQVDTAIFAYQPILSCLQEMTEIPLAEELLQSDTWGEKEETLPHQRKIAERMMKHEGHDLQTLLDTPDEIMLDESQKTSFIAGLSSRLALIQGPPGTMRGLTNIQKQY